MRRMLRIEVKGEYIDYDFNMLRSCIYEVQADGSMAFVVTMIEGGRDVYKNDESLSIKLIESKDEE